LAATERSGRSVLALALIALVSGPACGGTRGSATSRSGTPEGDLSYQQIDGSTFSLRLLRADGTDEPLPGRASQDAFLPAFSRAAGLIGFRGVDGGRAVLVMHAWSDDSERVLDLGDLDPFAPAISPDGATVAFEGIASGAQPHLYLAPLAGGGPVELGSGSGKDAGPAWSPDGLSVFFTSTRSGQWEIWRVAADGTGLTQITTGSKLVGRPSISPDGLSLAYARSSTSPTTLVVLRSLADGTETIVTSDAAEYDPDFDATGAHLVVATEHYGAPCLALRDTATGALVSRLTLGAGLQSAPAFAR
jgi:hypothetical protein